MADSTPVLTREFFVDFLHSDSSVVGSKAQIRTILDAFLAGVKSSLRAGHTVHFKGLGRFEVVATTKRIGRNPQTGEPLAIPPGRKVKFKPSKSLLAKEGDA